MRVIAGRAKNLPPSYAEGEEVVMDRKNRERMFVVAVWFCTSVFMSVKSPAPWATNMGAQAKEAAAQSAKAGRYSTKLCKCRTNHSTGSVGTSESDLIFPAGHQGVFWSLGGEGRRGARSRLSCER